MGFSNIYILSVNKEIITDKLYSFLISKCGRFEIFSCFQWLLMKQTYFKDPNYSKNYLIQNPQNLYEEYVNAFAFSEMVKSHNKAPNKKELQQKAQDSWREVKMKDKDIIKNRIFELLHTPIESYPFTFFSQEPVRKPRNEPPKSPDILQEPFDDIQPPSNTTAQKKLLEKLQKAKTDLYEYNNLLRAALSQQLRSQFTLKIKKLEEDIKIGENKLKQLRGNAAAQQRA